MLAYDLRWHTKILCGQSVLENVVFLGFFFLPLYCCALYNWQASKENLGMGCLPVISKLHCSCAN